MARTITKEELIKHKEEAINKLSSYLDSLIESDDKKACGKADKLSYWLKDYSKFLEFETEFTPTKILRYKRGNVIRANFGFNIGNEFGGLHLAVVIDNDNKRNAGTLTVIPLSSTDGKPTHSRNIDLGQELYVKINYVQQTLLSNAKKELEELEKLAVPVQTAAEILESFHVDSDAPITREIAVKYATALAILEDINSKREHLEETLRRLDRNSKEIARLKIGSMAVVNQITTISKQRIYTPRYSEDFLYGISLSPSAMDKINEKVKELYVFDKK